MKKASVMVVLIAAACLSFAGAFVPYVALAIPINYSFTGVGTGSLGGTAFTEATFTVSVNADTDNIQPNPLSDPDWGGTHIDNLTATINIGGFETATFSDSMNIIAYHNVGSENLPNDPNFYVTDFISLCTVSDCLFQVYDSHDGGQLTNYNLDGNVGPVTSFNPSFYFWSGSAASTSLGNLTFLEYPDIPQHPAYMSHLTFVATTDTNSVPEPSTLLLLGSGLLGLVGLNRRRKA